jgi:hypothetical protein
VTDEMAGRKPCHGGIAEQFGAKVRGCSKQERKTAASARAAPKSARVSSTASASAPRSLASSSSGWRGIGKAGVSSPVVPIWRISDWQSRS